MLELSAGLYATKKASVLSQNMSITAQDTTNSEMQKSQYTAVMHIYYASYFIFQSLSVTCMTFLEIYACYVCYYIYIVQKFHFSGVSKWVLVIHGLRTWTPIIGRQGPCTATGQSPWQRARTAAKTVRWLCHCNCCMRLVALSKCYATAFLVSYKQSHTSQ